jgi:hypothetical protein
MNDFLLGSSEWCSNTLLEGGKMKHPFEIGRKYRNRRGEYEVISLEGSKMVIRYSNGEVLETTVQQQERIWRNIQAEESMEAPVRRSDSHPRHRRRAGQRGLGFQGLQDRDFQKGTAGTSWRARKSLGGLLAQQMSDTTPHHFQSYAIYRRAQVHIAQPDYYDTETKRQNAKFAFGLDTKGARYGFYIEKNNGAMDDTWHWPNFLSALDNDAKLRQEVDTAMHRLELRWEIDVGADGGLVAQVQASSGGLTWEWQDRDESEEISWPAFVKRLRDIETEKWCNLYLCTGTAKDEAIAAGIQLVDTVVKVYRALLPLYQASTHRARSG